MNDAGTIAFVGIFGGSGLSAIFTQYGWVAGPGTMVEGREIENATLYRDLSMNNRGAIAFTARLVGGDDAIVLAQPVPEPATTILFIPAALTLLGAAKSATTTR
jgi:hypothetical protein